MHERSFIRFGGLAGILLAITSLATVAINFTLVPEAQRLPLNDPRAYVMSLASTTIGSQLFSGFYALIAFWALIGIVALYYRVRSQNEPWAFFALLVGVISSIATITNALYQVANVRYLATLPIAEAMHAVQAPSAANPLGLMTFGLTAVWFLIMAVLMPRAKLPALLGILGLVAFADLAVGFVATIAALPVLPFITALIAGLVGGPIFWAWLGGIFLRETRA